MKHRPSYTKTRPTVPPWHTEGKHRAPSRVAVVEVGSERDGVIVGTRVARASSVASLLALVVAR